MNTKHKFSNLGKRWCLAYIHILLIMFASTSYGSGIEILHSGTYSQDFDTLPGTGGSNTIHTWANNVTLPGWYIDSQSVGGAVTEIRTGPHSSNATSIYVYSYGYPLNAPERALGAVQTNTSGANAYAFGLLFRNASGTDVTFTAMNYRGEQYRYSGAAANTNTTWYRISGEPITSPSISIDSEGWTALPALDFTSPAYNTNNPDGLASGDRPDGNSANYQSLISAELDITLAAGEYIMFRFLDPDYPGTDHALGYDDLSVSWTVAGDGPDVPASWGGLEANEHGYVDTGAWLGWIHIQNQPWLWVYGLGAWVYSPQDPGVGADGAWLYVPNQDSQEPEEDVEPPSTPGNLTATVASASQIDLSWGASTDNVGVVGYDIYRDSQFLETTHLTEYADTGLTSERTYSYHVIAFDLMENVSLSSNVAQATTDARPMEGEKPGAHNTGPTNSEILTAYTGPMTITIEGTVIENRTISGILRIMADNVTIRNCVLVTTSPYNLQCTYGHSGLLIEDSELTGANSAMIYGGGFTARRLNLHHGGGDAIKSRSNVLVESCWIHRLGMGEGAHADGVQAREGGTNMVFRGNHFDMPVNLTEDGVIFRSNAAFIMEDAGGQITDTLIEGNWMNGGNFTVYGSNMAGITVRNNYFGRNYRYGIRDKVVNWIGNVWEDNGQPAP